MSISRSDRWTALETPQAVADAARRLHQLSDTAAEREARQRWLDLLVPRPGERILDAGAGIGEMAVTIAERVRPGGAVHALDLSAGLLDHTRRLACDRGVDQQLRTDVADARAMPYTDSTFDAALCRWVLLHLPDPRRVVAEMHRVVRPGGCILCVEVDWSTLSVTPGNPDTTGRIVRANVERQVDGCIGRRLAPLMRDAGMQDVSVIAVVNRDTTGDWLAFLHSRMKVAAEAGVPADALTAWWHSIEAAARSGQYRFSFTQYGATGIAAGASAGP